MSLALALAATLAAVPAAPARTWPPPRLSETGLYAAGTLTPAPDARPFSPQYPLWSDGAQKRRWVRLPRGAKIDARNPEAWVLPVGTRFWKEFSFQGQKVETRYLEKAAAGRWLYATYGWSRDQADATLVPPEGRRGVVELAPGASHDLPSHDDCRACHEGAGRDAALGFGALQLSPERDPLAPHAEPLPEHALDLAALAREGLLRGAPAAWAAAPPVVVASSPAARAALGYLHGNCWGCHNELDPVSSVGMSLRVSLGAKDESEQPAVRTGLGQRSKFQVPGVAPGASLRLSPGDEARDALLFRMRSRHPLRQMPPLGSKLVDDEALSLLSRWLGGG